MALLIVRRIGFGIVLIVAVSIVVFVIVGLTPGDAASVIAGPHSTAAQVAQVRHELGLDLPLPVQNANWFSHAVRGDLGSSIVNSQPVLDLLNSRLAVTLLIVLLSTAFTAILGVAAGAWSAYRGGVVGRAIDVVSMLTFSLPSYWLGLLLVLVFAVELRLLPAVGYVDFAASPANWARSLILPVATLAIGGAAGVARQTRDSMLSTLDQEFVLAHRADGVPERTIVFRHALRNCAAPILSMIGLFFVGSLSGTVLIEQVFLMPGLGGLAVSSAAEHDIPVIEGIAVYFAILVVVVNLVLDLIFGWLNPKARTT
jgi:peptide/nickel transport system permease protein